MKPDTAETEAARDDFMRMEGCIVDLQSWADLLVNLGSCPNAMQSGVSSVVGRAIDDLAGRLADHWDAIHKGRPAS